MNIYAELGTTQEAYAEKNMREIAAAIRALTGAGLTQCRGCGTYSDDTPVNGDGFCETCQQAEDDILNDPGTPIPNCPW